MNGLSTFAHKKINVDVKFVWVSYADALSKQIDYDEWALTTEFFQYLNDLWDPFTVDRFCRFRECKSP